MIKHQCAGITYLEVVAQIVCDCGYQGNALNAFIDNDRSNLMCPQCGYLDQPEIKAKDVVRIEVTETPGFVPLEVGEMVRRIKQQPIPTGSYGYGQH